MSFLSETSISQNIVTNMDNEDYDTLPTEWRMSTHMLAGAAAGIMEHATMYPVDCVKVTTSFGLFVCNVIVPLWFISELNPIFFMSGNLLALQRCGLSGNFFSIFVFFRNNRGI